MHHMDTLLSKNDILPQPTNTFFGTIIYEPGGTYGPRIQECYQLVILHQGHAWVHLDGERFYLREGEVALLKPGHHEFFEFAKPMQTHHSWCHFYWRVDNATKSLLERLPFSAPLSHHMEQLVSLGISLQHDPHSMIASAQHIAAAAFWEYVSLTLSSPTLTTPYAQLPRAVQRAQAHVATHYQHELTLAELSEIAHVTPKHLTRLFHQHLKITPMRYVWQVRAQQGASYLRHTGIPIERIALSCGFKTVAHFSRIIKAQYGQTPVQVRTQHWQQHRKGEARVSGALETSLTQSI